MASGPGLATVFRMKGMMSSRDAEWARLAEEGHEARAWLERPDTALFWGPKAKGSELVEALYAAGAVKVSMVDAHVMQEAGGREIGATFAAELPPDPQARQACFDAYNDLFPDDPKEDNGQAFLTHSE